jgi:TetR/AcrR family transcriptional repressor of nem operon
MDAAYELIWEFSYSSVTIDAICERASVKKGSFYYFFESKSDLALAAIDAWWAERQLLLEKVFAPARPPLERIRDYLDYVAQRQLAAYAATGQVLGCPIYGLGAEMCTQDEKIREKIRTILGRLAVYFEQAMTEAHALGELTGGNPAQKARVLLHCYAGLLTQARIDNNPEILERLSADVLEFVTASQSAPERDFLPA